MIDVAQRILGGYAWLLISVLLLFLWQIAGFYGQASGERVGHSFLLLPGVLLAAGALSYLVHDSAFVGEPVGDLLLFAGGLLLFLFANRLEQLMTRE